MTDDEIREALKLDFEQTADWRRSKAAEYPRAPASRSSLARTSTLFCLRAQIAS